MVTAALRAIPFPHRRVFGFVVLVTAYMALLATWIPYLDKLFTLPCKFILQFIREHITAIDSQGFTKTNHAPSLAFRNSLDAYILNANGIMDKTVSKHPVVNESGTSKGVDKHNFLFGCRVEPIPVYLIHYNHLP